MSTSPREHDLQLAAAVLGTLDPALVEHRREEAVQRMRAAREALKIEISGVEPIEALRDDQWSIIHVLTHLGADGGGHFSPVYDMLQRGVRELDPYEKRQERFRSARLAAFEEMDDAIAFSSGLEKDQLAMHARKGGREHYVIEFLEATAAHFEDHLVQLRSIRRHLAEVRERRKTVVAS